MAKAPDPSTFFTIYLSPIEIDIDTIALVYKESPVLVKWENTGKEIIGTCDNTKICGEKATISAKGYQPQEIIIPKPGESIEVTLKSETNWHKGQHIYAWKIDKTIIYTTSVTPIEGDDWYDGKGNILTGTLPYPYEKAVVNKFTYDSKRNTLIFSVEM